MNLSSNLDFERIEASFRAIAANPSAWQRRILLDQAATYNGIVKSTFRKAFEEWQLEATCIGKGGGSNA